MLRPTNLALTLGTLMFLSGCAVTAPSIPESAVLTELAPMNRLSHQVGDRFDFTNKLTGQPGHWVVTDVAADGAVSATMHDGCKWTTSSAWFDGTGSWENCGTGDWSAATSTLLDSGPSLWPLTDGASSTYRYKTTNKVGKSDTHKRTCNVSTANIETSIGPVDTYKVVCTDKNGSSINVRTWYFNPDHGEIRFSRWKPDGGMKVNHQYL